MQSLCFSVYSIFIVQAGMKQPENVITPAILNVILSVFYLYHAREMSKRDLVSICAQLG